MGVVVFVVRGAFFFVVAVAVVRARFLGDGETIVGPAVEVIVAHSGSLLVALVVSLSSSVTTWPVFSSIILVLSGGTTILSVLTVPAREVLVARRCFVVPTLLAGIASPSPARVVVDIVVVIRRVWTGMMLLLLHNLGVVVLGRSTAAHLKFAIRPPFDPRVATNARIVVVAPAASPNAASRNTTMVAESSNGPTRKKLEVILLLAVARRRMFGTILLGCRRTKPATSRMHAIVSFSARKLEQQ